MRQQRLTRNLYEAQTEPLTDSFSKSFSSKLAFFQATGGGDPDNVYTQPDGTSLYYQPDGISLYTQP
jgi:hypothetical protein